MLKATLLENIKTRPDVFGTRLHVPLPGSRKPLPTLPSIVGNHIYTTMADNPYCKAVGCGTRGQSPGQTFLQQVLEKKRLMSSQVAPLSEPNQNNPQR